jgi:hypothetical protein
MKNIVTILISISLICFYLTGCTAKYGRGDPEKKQVLYTVTGGIAGVLVVGNPGGVLVGALAADIFHLSTVKYEDKLLLDREEAAKQYNRDQAEKKEDERKVEKKEDERKVEKKEDERKVEKKEDERKVEKKEDERKAKLFIEKTYVTDQNVQTGSMVEVNIQYTLLAPVDMHQIEITETRILRTADGTFELAKRDVVRTQGTHLSTIKFTMPYDVPRGYCILYTTISIGNYAKTAKSILNNI